MTLGTSKWLLKPEHLGDIYENDRPDTREKGIELNQMGCIQQSRRESSTAAVPPRQPALVLVYHDMPICLDSIWRRDQGRWVRWPPNNFQDIQCPIERKKNQLRRLELPRDPDLDSTSVWLKYEVASGDGESYSTHAVCFQPSIGGTRDLGSLPEANPDRESDCNPPVKEFTLWLALPAGVSFEQIGRLRLVARYDGKDRPFDFDKNPYVLREFRPPGTISLSGDNDFQNDTWQVTNGTSLDIRLRAKNKNIEVMLKDSEEPARTIPRATVDVTAPGGHYTLARAGSGTQSYTGTGSFVRGDTISFSVEAPGYRSYKNNSTYDGRLTSWTIILEPDLQSVSLKPFVLDQNQEHPVNVNVTVKYKGANGEETHRVPGTARGGYPARLPRDGTDPVTVIAEDGGSGNFQTVSKIVSKPLQKEIPIELKFAKPILSVVYNPNMQLARMQGTNTSETDLKINVWNLFQSLCNDEEWRKKYAYRYLMSMYERGHQKIVASAEDTGAQTDAQFRETVLSEFRFQDLPVTPEAAIGDIATFLRGFRFPDKGRRGVLVYILGAPSNPVLVDDPKLAELDRMLGDARMLAVVAAFLPGAPSKKTKFLTTERHRNLRYLEFGASEEAQFYFSHSFGDIRSAIGDLLAGSERPQLKVTSTHTTGFKQGQTASYLLTVSNSEDASPTRNTVKVTNELPAGFELMSMDGYHWNCVNATCERNDALAGGDSYPAITVKVNVRRNAPASAINKVTVTDGGLNVANVDDPVTVVLLPALSVSSTHTGNFMQGQHNAMYLLRVSNSAAAGETSGPVRVSEQLPDGLVLVSMSGNGWECKNAEKYCVRNDVLRAGGNYPDITVMADVSPQAPTPVINQAIAEHESLVPAVCSDPTEITIRNAQLKVSFIDPHRFKQGQRDAIYTVVVSNAQGAGTTHGRVTVKEMLPRGLDLVSMQGGKSWKCKDASCEQDNPLAGGQSYDPITVKVSVAKDAPVSLRNEVSVEGGSSGPEKAEDTTSIDPNSPSLSVVLSHQGGAFKQGQSGVYHIKVTNAPGAATTSGSVLVKEELPEGLELASMVGDKSWECKGASCACSDPLPGGSSYSLITVTVNVLKTAPASVTNQVSVSGGGAPEIKGDDRVEVIKEQQ